MYYNTVYNITNRQQRVPQELTLQCISIELNFSAFFFAVHLHFTSFKLAAAQIKSIIHYNYMLLFWLTQLLTPNTYPRSSLGEGTLFFLTKAWRFILKPWRLLERTATHSVATCVLLCGLLLSKSLQIPNNTASGHSVDASLSKNRQGVTNICNVISPGR